MAIPQKEVKSKQDPAVEGEENWGVEGVDWEYDVDQNEPKDQPKEEPKEEDWGQEGVDWYWSGEDEDETEKDKSAAPNPVSKTK